MGFRGLRWGSGGGASSFRSHHVHEALALRCDRTTQKNGKKEQKFIRKEKVSKIEEKIGGGWGVHIMLVGGFQRLSELVSEMVRIRFFSTCIP